ncbi:MAG: exodeoxyribonuclease VII large subunit [Rhodospirillales bacterium]|nr:exodeoxyribonuclease VII large subunit [Rhodospirillales bacterium]
MSDPSSTHNSGDNVPVFSVTELSGLVKSTVEGAFQHVRLRGEISGFKRAASGHLYFSLKDEDAVMDGVCWRTSAGRLGIKPEDGMEVIASGRITTYPGRSKYQIVVESMELAGEGALLKLLEDRKRKLALEGLFDEERKRDLPYLPDVIGVVTSPTGAVIRDILHRLADRFPRRVLVWPVLVQGEGAAEQIARAIRGFNALPMDGPVPRPDLLIVARGGGSLEDLWAFNEEVVVRAAAESEIPLISAVGHETDWTLIDLASDQRAPTPTAAAEMAVPVRLEVMAQINENEGRLLRAVRRRLESKSREVAALARGLPNLQRVVESAGQRLDDWTERLGNALKAGIRQRRQRLPKQLFPPRRAILQARQKLETADRDLRRGWQGALVERQKSLGHLSQLLESYSYERVLDRGFALLTTPAGKAVTAVAALSPGDDVNIRLKDGVTAARIAGSGPAAPTRKQKPATHSSSGDDPQGSLL